MKKSKKHIALFLCMLMVCMLFAGCDNIRITTNISKQDLLKSDAETLSIGEAKLYLMTLVNEYKTRELFRKDYVFKRMEAGFTRFI